MEELLPLGSIVTLKGGVKPIMIAGRMVEEQESRELFTYCAVLWPEGIIDSEKMYLFNEKDIETVWFIGMQDRIEFTFRKRLIEEMKKERPSHTLFQH